jgi:hypothetical protein
MRKSLVLWVCLTACGSTIRVVSTTKQGGEIVLEGSRESAMGKAREQMARACGGEKAYEIVEEGEASSLEKPAGEVKDPHEWRVRYECKAAGQ